MGWISFAAILILTFAFGYLNGLNGAGSILATVVPAAFWQRWCLPVRYVPARL